MERTRRSHGDRQAVKQESHEGRKDEGENDSRNHEGSDVGRGTGRASARGVRGRMRVGFRPSPAGGEEATGEGEGKRQKARAKEEGRRPPEAGKRTPEGSNRAAEEDKRPRAEGTGSADKPTEEGAKGAGEEGGGPRAAGPEGEEVDVRLVRERTRGSRGNEVGRTLIALLKLAER